LDTRRGDYRGRFMLDLMTNYKKFFPKCLAVIR
jgi:hypothetical protein